MPEPTAIASFLLVAIVVIVVPGPSVIFVIGRAMILGTTGALLSVWGNALGVGVQILAVAFGVGALVSASDFLFTAVKVLVSGFFGLPGDSRDSTPSRLCGESHRGSDCRCLASAPRQHRGGTYQRQDTCFFHCHFPAFR